MPSSHGGGGPASSTGGGGGAGGGGPRPRSVHSATTTLCVCILGSSVLPVPHAFARAGLVPGLAILASVAAANAYGCAALLRAGEATGGTHTSYEGVVRAVAGRAAGLATRALLVALLAGTLAGDWALLAEVGPAALARLRGVPPAQPLPLAAARAAAASLAALTAPLCFLPRLRSLEAASSAGVGLVAALVAVVAGSATAAGWPGLRPGGGFPVWAPVSRSALAEFFAVAGYAMYLAPLVFPVVAEEGSAATGAAIKKVVLVVAPLVYGVLGVAGPGRWGAETAPSLLENSYLGGGRADGAMDAAVVLYLCISIPPVVHALRQTLEAAVAGEGAPPSRGRSLALTSVAVFTPLAAALAAPASAEAMFAATGALPVCVLCYLLPAYLDVKVRQREVGVADGEDGGEVALLDAHARPLPPLPSLAAPLAVAALGLASSAAAAWYSVQALAARWGWW